MSSSSVPILERRSRGCRSRDRMKKRWFFSGMCASHGAPGLSSIIQDIPSQDHSPIRGGWRPFQPDELPILVPEASGEVDDSSLASTELCLRTAENLKLGGNQHVSQNNWQDALQCYSTAIAALKHQPVKLPDELCSSLFANRALVHMKLLQWEEGEADCTRALASNEHNAKARYRTTRWANFIDEQAIREVSYALIDVEGHEVPVIAGMDLEQRRKSFPLFQYELGGTWFDHRHSGNLTQEEMARHLERLGYRLFLIGGSRHGPTLMPVGADVFRDALAAKCFRSGDHYVVQGNTLAVLESVAARRPYLTNAIDQMVAADRELR